MSTKAKSGHGAVISYEADPVNSPGTWTDFAEMGDVTPPELNRNEFDASTQNEDIDSWVLGILRRSAAGFKVNFLPTTEASHGVASGLYKMMKENSVQGFKFAGPDNWTMIASGQVKSIAPTSPVDGLQSAQITLRFSGKMWINSVLFG